MVLILCCLSARAYKIEFSYNSTINFYSPPDTIPPDTTVTDSTLTDSSTVRKVKLSADTLDAPVKYKAVDTIWYDITNQRVYLLGLAEVSYKDITLKADSIIFDWKNNEVIAMGRPDSSGKLANKPVFSQGDRSYEAQVIVYNFKTKKGKISEIITQEGEGFIHSEKVKRYPNEVLFGKNNLYTTCNKEHPHFFIAASKIKVIPGKSIVTGAANLVVADVPTPLVLPFGIFPLNDKRKSGIIFPEYGEEADKGFFLRNGGYYFGISDHVDLALTGDIYSRGSWAVSAASRFIKRYKYSGNFRTTFANYRTFNTELNTYESSKEFDVNATFSEDSKARPNSVFKASVSFGTSGFNQVFASTYNSNYLNNTYTSSISYYQSIPYTPFQFTVAAFHTQSTLSHTVNVSLPDFSFDMNQVYPFRRKEVVGKERWYEKVGLSYSLNLVNRLSGIDSTFFTTQTLDRRMTGIQHHIPIAAPFQLFKHLTVTPAFNYTETWAFETFRQQWNPDSAEVEFDTIPGFASTRDFNFSLSSSTRIYGMFKFRHGKIKAIRHVLNPGIGFSYHPDFSDAQWNTYKTVQIDEEGTTDRYSIFSGGIYSGPGEGEFGGINFSLGNNLEMKVFSKKDTVTQTKKIGLLDALNLSSGYNLAVDSLNWSPLSVSARTRLFEKVDFNVGSHFDPYVADSDGRRINKYEWDVNHRLFRLTDASIGINGSFQSPKSKATELTEEQAAYVIGSMNDYLDFNIPWSFTAGYNLFLRKVNTESGNDSLTFTQTLNFSAQFNLSKNWKISGSTSYDFVNHQFPTANLQIYRDLHCWEMSINWTPFGIRQGYYFVLRVKAGVLQDLKIPKRQDWNAY